MKKLLEAGSDLERYMILLDRVKEITNQLNSLEKEVSRTKEHEEEGEDKLQEIELSVKEIETINKQVKDYLDKSLVWMLGVVSFIFGILIALLGAAGTMLISHLRNVK